MAALVVASAGILGRFAGPQPDPRSLALGQIDRFPPGSVTTFAVSADLDFQQVTYRHGLPYGGLPQSGVFHVVRPENGELLIFSGRYPHPRGCTLGWLPDFEFRSPSGEAIRGQFRDPCLGSSWDISGRRLFGPAPRDLDRYEARVVDGQVFIDLTRLTPGEWRVTFAPAPATPAPVVPDPRGPSGDR